MAKKFDAKAKAKRQKIIAAVLGVLLLGVLAYEVPSLMKTMNKKPPASAAAAVPAPVTPAAVTPAAGTPVAAAAPGSGTLTDSDPAPQAGTGQLLSFDRFATKDPFVQQAGAPIAAPAPAPAPAAAATPPPPPPPPPPSAARQPAGRASARISVNGVAQNVSVTATFPAADPVFVLVSLQRTSAKVGIAGGSLSTGTSTVKLLLGKKVTLMNTADGTRYVLLLVSVG
ncbi:MAG TPA: hypothetical protein VF877_04105 [Gaiellaceae bacterium]